MAEPRFDLDYLRQLRGLLQETRQRAASGNALDIQRYELTRDILHAISETLLNQHIEGEELIQGLREGGLL